MEAIMKRKRIMLLVITLILSLALPMTVSANTAGMPLPGSDLTENIKTITSTAANDLIGDGLDHVWVEYIPSTLDDSSPVPIVIMLHGAGLDGAGMLTVSQLISSNWGWNYLAERENFIMVFPSATVGGLDSGGLWRDTFRESDEENVDVQFIKGLIEYYINDSDINIDPERIYLGGVSNGEMMTVRFASSQYADLLAGLIMQIGVISESHMWDGAPGNPVRPSIAVPVYQFRGADDLIILRVAEDGGMAFNMEGMDLSNFDRSNLPPGMDLSNMADMANRENMPGNMGIVGMMQNSPEGFDLRSVFMGGGMGGGSESEKV
jgi:poly(3-hydroxybutyrate) depolymerase